MFSARTFIPLAAWWSHAWLTGASTTNATVDAILSIPTGTEASVEHLWAASGQADEAVASSIVALMQDPAEGLLRLLSEARRMGATGMGCALPREGDLAGLRGPTATNRAVLEAGGALVALHGHEARLLGAAAQAFIPEFDAGEEEGATLTWSALPVQPRPPGDIGEADRSLRRVVIETADALAELDVVSWAPEAADALLNLDRPPMLVAPPGVPEKAQRLAAQCLFLLDVVDEALSPAHDTSPNVTVAWARRDALEVLERAARHGLQWAASPDAWPS